MEQDYNLKKWSKGCPNTGINCRRSSCGIEYVFIPAALGDDQKGSPVAPKNGSYNNAVVYYEATGNVYLYSSDGVPTRVEKNLDSIIAELQKELNDVEEALSEETTAREAADAALDGRIDTVADNLATETANRISADEDLQADIATETTARQNADTALQNNITAEATNRANADSALQTNINTVSGNLSAEITARQNADTALGNRVTAIEEKIPAQASAQNQLADKDFVNSSVATNTANYISNNGQPFNSLAELEAYSGTLTNNDYAFVVGTDQAGNTTYTRYKYVASTDSWAEEYVLNNSSFTAVQWATINSGITSGDVSKLNNLANIQTIGTNLALTNGELSATDTTYTAGTGLDLTGTQFSIDNATVATQSDLAAGLAGKQDTLTAGANITIDANNVISATGGGSGGVSDVQIAGTSIVNGGVANIDYASASKVGVIRTNTDYGTSVTSVGALISATKTYQQYQDTTTPNMFISKGTLENVITGKGLVSNTDYASSSIGGTIRTSNASGLGISNGNLYAVTKTYNTYNSASDNMFIGKGTLENIITGKGLVDQTALATKQDVLTAGTGISINNNVISATGGGGGLDPNTTFWGQTASNGVVDGAINISSNSGGLPGMYIGYGQIEIDKPAAFYLRARKNSSTYSNVLWWKSASNGVPSDVHLDAAGTKMTLMSNEVQLKGRYSSDHVKISNVATPQNDTDAATKGYVDTVVNGIESELDAKQDVLTAGANITIDANNVISATGGGSADITIDGQTTLQNGLGAVTLANHDENHQNDGVFTLMFNGQGLVLTSTTTDATTGQTTEVEFQTQPYTGGGGGGGLTYYDFVDTFGFEPTQNGTTITQAQYSAFVHSISNLDWTTSRISYSADNLQVGGVYTSFTKSFSGYITQTSSDGVAYVLEDGSVMIAVASYDNTYVARLIVSLQS